MKDDKITYDDYFAYLAKKEGVEKFEKRVFEKLEQIRQTAMTHQIYFRFTHEFTMNEHMVAFVFCFDDAGKDQQSVYMKREKFLDKTDEELYQIFKEEADLENVNKKVQEERNYQYYLQLKQHYTEKGKA